MDRKQKIIPKYRIVLYKFGRIISPRANQSQKLMKVRSGNRTHPTKYVVNVRVTENYRYWELISVHYLPSFVVGRAETVKICGIS